MSQKLRLVRVVSLMLALGLSVAAVNAQNETENSAEEQQRQAEQPEQKKQKKGSKSGGEERQKEGTQIQVFRLKHAKPSDIQQLISMAIASRPATSAGESTGGQADAAAEQEASQEPENVRVASDDESSMLFVRGSQKCLDQVKQLVTAVDTPSGKVKRNELSGMLLVPLSNDKAGRVLGVLQQLEISVNTLAFGEEQLLVIDVQQTDNAEQVKKVLEAFEEKNSEAKENEKPESDKTNE